MYRYIISLILLASICAEPIKINLITTNDIHGVIGEQKANFMNPQYPPTIIGGAAFAKYMDDLRVEIQTTEEEILVLDGGNFFQGSSLGMANNGKTMIEWMNRIGYDGLVPGIYDFISGAKNLNELSKLANFPFLFSNLSCSSCPLVNSNIIPYINRTSDLLFILGRLEDKDKGIKEVTNLRNLKDE